MQGANASFQALIGSSANKHIPSEQRATFLSSISFVSRIGMLGCLAGVKLAVEKVGIQNLYWMSFAASLAMLPLLFSWQSSPDDDAGTTFWVDPKAIAALKREFKLVPMRAGEEPLCAIAGPKGDFRREAIRSMAPDVGAFPLPAICWRTTCSAPSGILASATLEHERRALPL